jgi:hypothetical protein
MIDLICTILTKRWKECKQNFEAAREFSFPHLTPPPFSDIMYIGKGGSIYGIEPGAKTHQEPLGRSQ